MAGIIELNRFAFLGTGYVPLPFLLLSFGTGCFLCVTGLLAFRRVERTFVDTI